MNTAANPNGESEEGLAGDMGVSSQRRTGYEGVEGTGSSASTQGRTDGASETHPDQVEPSSEVHRQVQDEEENPATLRSHEDIRSANPHPRRDDD